MSGTSQTPNWREGISAQNTINGRQEYITSTNHALNVNASVSISGSAIPVSGATTAIVTAIVDGSGNQITSFGGGTQYTDGGVPPAHPIGNTLEWSDGSNWQTVSTAKPLPVTASFSPSGTQDVNITKVAGSAISQGHGTAATAIRVELPTDGTGIVGLNAGSNVIGHVITDSGSVTNATLSAETTKVIGTVNQGTSPWIMAGGGTAGSAATGVLTIQGIAAMTPILATVTATNLSTNIAQVNGATVNVGAGAAGTGTQRVTTSTDSTIGTITSVTQNADVRQATASNLNATVVQGTGSNLHTVLDSGTLTTLTTLTGTTTLTPGTGATNLGKAEDAPHTTGDVGVLALAVRNDSGSVSAGSDGDYIALTTDAQGALRIDLNGTISTNNSTTASLTSGSVFTGTSEDVLNYNEIRINVISNVASATDGLSIQQSSDNSNWDIVDTYTIPAATGKTYAVPRQARYFRIVYTNGGTNQASFRLQTILNRENPQASSQRPSDGYTNETDLEQMQAFGMVWNGTTWDRAPGNTTAQFNQGATASGSAIAARPLTGGGQARTTNPTAVADTQVVNATFDKLGKQVVVGSIRDLKVQQQTTITTSTAETTVLTAVASTFLDVYGVIVVNSSVTASNITFKDATSGTTRFNIYVPAGDTRGFMLPESAAHNQATVNNNWTATSSASVTSILVTMLAVKNI